ncbi:hypothetical protein HY230_02055 [Candidatus Acetothermia bacterium]|nr:hypothetical protein [Candidatus Acetothermia bacterium]
MSGLVEVIKYFYEDFILRDFLAYVTPGAILIGAVILLQFSDNLSQVREIIKEIPFILYIPIFGVLFIVGYALEGLGERLGILKWHGYCNDEQALKALVYIQSIETITKEVGLGDRLRLYRERYSVKKHMCGNASVSIALSLVLLFCKILYPILFYTALVALTSILVIALGFGHHDLLKRQTSFENEVLEFIKAIEKRNAIK